MGGLQPRALQDVVVMDTLRGLAGILRPPTDTVAVDILGGLAGNDGMLWRTDRASVLFRDAGKQGSILGSATACARLSSTGRAAAAATPTGERRFV